LVGLDLSTVAWAFIERTRDREGNPSYQVGDVLGYLRAASSNTAHTPLSGHQQLWDDIVEELRSLGCTKEATA
jgi:hypothetical protein